MPINWKRWLRWLWWRNRNRNPSGEAKVLALIGSLVALDQVSKYLLGTADWAWHNQGAAWTAQSLATTALVGLLLLTERFRLAAAFLVAGGLGNLLSELSQNTIANPFQTQMGDTFVAFNAADVMLLTGMALGVIATVTVAHSILKEQPA